jgi:hypothetical protein
MIEVKVDSIRVSLLSSRRLVVLQEKDVERYLPIWIGDAEADSITIKLQEMPISRPLTHDLLKNVIESLGARVVRVAISDLVDNEQGGGTFIGRLILAVDGKEIEVDSRPSDAIALAVRVDAPIYVAESVLERAGIVPSENLEDSYQEGDLSVFRDFLDGLES